MRVEGPFRFSRHPLNLAPLPVLWLQPVMTTRWLGFNAVATLYLVLGSAHEERRLEAAYGEPYRRYVREGPPFFLPARTNPHPPGPTAP
jgi:protein-S-isoprenylcysteine O-methyltransferase Ste14